MGAAEKLIPERLDKSLFDQWFDQRFETKMAERDAAHVPSLSIIATKGTMDWAYPPFILASTASALGWDVSIFFTFYGLELLKKDLTSRNQSARQPQHADENAVWPRSGSRTSTGTFPTSSWRACPGFEKVATGLMEQTVKNKGVATIDELRGACLEADVKLFACQMTVDLFGHSQDEFIPEIEGWIGAASFLPTAQKSDVCLFI